MKFLRSTFDKAAFLGIGVLLLIGFVTFSGGCDSSVLDFDTPAPPNSDDSGLITGANNAGTSISAIRTFDEELADLAQRVPGFGGYFYDENQKLVVYLRNPQTISSLIPILLQKAQLGVLGFRNINDLGNLEVRQGQHDFVELNDWKEKVLTCGLDINGIVFVDADERLNRVVVGVDNLGKAAYIENAVEKFGIPKSAIVTEVAEYVKPLVDLKDKIRPVAGGLEITNDASETCTLGFNVTRNGQWGFITNSHCTRIQGGTEWTDFYQDAPGLFGGNDIGTEAVDPPYTNSMRGCPSGKVCRESDAAYISYSLSTVDISGGRIYRTSSSGQWSGSTTISGNFQIVGEVDYYTVGTTINKIGKTTGWTRGPVDRTCVNVGQAGSNIWLFCQTEVAAGSSYGDSGSPVFHIDSGNQVTLTGVLWGGASGIFVYSHVNLIKREIGGTIYTH